jgi:hypothetical protein
VPTGPTKAWARRLQRALEQVKGVTAARIILDQAQQIEEIHLVGSAVRKPKQIVRDVESLLFAQYGIRMDYRKISVVQLDGAGVSPIPSRLRFVEAMPDPQALDTVRVLLQNDGRTFQGTAPAPTSDVSPVSVDAVAQATMGAVQQAIGDVAHLSFGSAQSVVSGDQSIVLVVVHAATAQGRECLTGTCVVRGNTLAAVAKATLDAVNRRLPIWFTQPRIAESAEPLVETLERSRAG